MRLRLLPLVALTLCATSVAAQTTLPLDAGTSIERNVVYTSASGNHTLTYQDDGNLVVRPAAGGFTWGLNTETPNFSQGVRIEMATDGRLTVYDSADATVWGVPESGADPASQLDLTPGGVLQVVSPSQGVLWASDGSVTLKLFLPFSAGTVIERNVTYTSASGDHILIYGGDGNLVVRPAGGGFLWGLNLETSAFSQSARIELAADGRLTVYDASDATLWRAPEEGADPASVLDLTTQGALQVISPSQGVLWSSDGVIPSERSPSVFLRENVTACREGLTALAADRYQLPDDPATGSAGRAAWNSVLATFEEDGRAACDGVGAFLTAFEGEAAASDAEAAIAASGAANWADYLTGFDGLITVGEAITASCPSGTDGVDCQSAADRIGSVIADMTSVLDELDSTSCTPDAGWETCRTFLAPSIRLMGTAATSESALNVAEMILTEMVSRLQPSLDPAMLDGYVVYLTNGEPWSVLSQIAPVNTMMGFESDGTPRGDELRGGSGFEYLWITEQMICKIGVTTRNDAFQRGDRAERDDTPREYDQVVHEFGHTIHQVYGFNDRVEQVYAALPLPFEQYAWAVQGLFNTPARMLNMNEINAAFLAEAFESGSAFSCDAYDPENVTVANETEVTPVQEGVLRAWPNPAADRANIVFELEASGAVHLAVYDALGREVAVLADGIFPAGRSIVTWDTDRAASGLYVYRLRAGATVQTQTLIVAR